MDVSPCKVLIVDDEKFNLAVLSALLNDVPCESVCATSGEEALSLAEDKKPDIILLDLMMPGMNGYDVVAHLKKRPTTRNIPVIMLTALDDWKARVQALEAGAEEFLTKPVSKAELQLRVRNLLKLKKYHDQLESQSLQLKEKVAEGNQRLDQAQAKLLQSEKLASIGQLAAGVAHEINNPIGFIKSNLSTLQDYVSDILSVLDRYHDLEKYLPANNEALSRLKEFEASADFEFICSDIRHLIAQSLDGVARVAKIIQDLKAFARSDANQAWSLANLQECVESALNIAFNEIKYKADIVREFQATPPIECLPAQLSQVFLNLLVNAAQSIDDRNGRGKITVRIGMANAERAWVEIQDSGCGMPDEIRQRIFDPFFTTKPVGVGTGLGLSISYGIIERHGGTINVDSKPGQGSTFRIELPILQPDETPEKT